jgi:mono/diheme cytochrome c family protein
MASGILRSGGRALIYLLALVGLVALVATGAFVSAGIAARPRPSDFEERVARAARHLLIPATARREINPVAATPAVLSAARKEFAGECATCHGNDGMGATRYGTRLSPRAPDLSDTPTQRLSDGELHWIIDNGVKLTGMPGFGEDEPGHDAESWGLVDFIRHLPEITPEETAEMERFNPALSPAEVEKERRAGSPPDGAGAQPPATPESPGTLEPQPDSSH